jgi:hypothetical protein
LSAPLAVSRSNDAASDPLLSHTRRVGRHRNGVTGSGAVVNAGATVPGTRAQVMNTVCGLAATSFEVAQHATLAAESDKWSGTAQNE